MRPRRHSSRHTLEEARKQRAEEARQEAAKEAAPSAGAAALAAGEVLLSELFAGGSKTVALGGANVTVPERRDRPET